MAKAEAKERSALKVAPLLWLPIVVSTIFFLLILRSQYPSTLATKKALSQGPPKQLGSVIPTISIAANNNVSLSGAATVVQGSHHQSTSIPVLFDGVVEEVCNVSMGRWVRDPRGPVYTNVTCSVLPDSSNCGKYGKDPGYQYWRWQPDGCEIPRFDAAAFLDVVRGKTMAFVGDSLARNQMESLLCLLSTAEAPVDQLEEPSVRILRWRFPSHNFTVMHIWTEYFVDAIQKVVNGTVTGSFDINLDKMHPRWADKLPGLDYLLLSGGNWQFRKNYLHEGGKVIGCIGCREEGLPDLGVKFSIRKVVRAALEYVSQCRECAGLTTLLRTFSYSHFDGGLWSEGHCKRTAPLNESELDLATDIGWEIRNIQLEEMARIRERLRKEEATTHLKFGLLDVTKAMIMRPDGHPGVHSSKFSVNVTDCLHWCLPGPVDMWSELLLATLTTKSWLYY